MMNRDHLQLKIINQIFENGVKRNWWIDDKDSCKDIGHMGFDDINGWDMLTYRFGIKNYKNLRQKYTIYELDRYLLELMRNDLPKELLKQAREHNIKIRFFSLTRYPGGLSKKKNRKQYFELIYKL